MSQPSTHPLESLLVAIGQAAPQPWYYKQYVRQTAVEPQRIEALLEFLWLEGLITRAEEGIGGTGPGITLTQFGQQVLDDPETRKRLSTGEPLSNTQGAIVRNSLRRPVMPWVTRTLLVANLAVFGYCIWLANSHNLASAYLSGGIGGNRGQMGAVIARVLHPAGGVSGIDIIQGDWWRLITSCFVHGGILHILMNMYALRAAGSFVEQTWGHWRYLVLYCISGWVGACVGVAHSNPVVLGVGASGALCGVLAAEGAWFYLNGRHLPRDLASRGRSQFWTNIVLMVCISMLPGIGGWAHLGGAIGGAAAGIVLHFQRFSLGLFRIVGLLALIPIPWYAYTNLQEIRGKSKAWQEAELLVFENDVLPKFGKTMRATRSAQIQMDLVEERHAVRRDPEEVAAAIQKADEQIRALSELLAVLRKAGPYRNEQVEKARQTAMEYAQASEAVFQEVRRSLTQGTEWTKAEEKALQELKETLAEKRKAWAAELDR
jgi:membrane associated rhomboid family serine protease